MKIFFKQLRELLSGKYPDYTEVISSRLRQAELQKLLDKAEYERDKLISKLNYFRMNAPIDAFDEFVDEPSDEKQRLVYIGSVDEFYENILKKKITGSVGEVRDLLASAYVDPRIMATSRENYDAFLRGMEAGLRKISDWAETLQAELREYNK